MSINDLSNGVFHSCRNTTISRMKISFNPKFRRWLESPQGLWQLVCLSVFFLAAATIGMVIYLDSIDDSEPFTVFDNRFYTIYYFLLMTFSSFLLLVGNNISVGSSSWKWIRRIGLACVYTEIHGVGLFLLTSPALLEDLQYDEEAAKLVAIVVCLSLVRGMIVTLAFAFCQKLLNRQVERFNLDHDFYGHTSGDLCDMVVAELLVLNFWYGHGWPFLCVFFLILAYLKFFRFRHLICI